MVDHVGSCCAAGCQQPSHSAPDQGLNTGRHAGRRRGSVSNSSQRFARTTRHRRGRPYICPLSRKRREADVNVFMHLTKRGTMNKPLVSGAGHAQCGSYRWPPRDRPGIRAAPLADRGCTPAPSSASCSAASPVARTARRPSRRSARRVVCCTSADAAAWLRR